MAETVGALIIGVRDRLDEVGARQWSDPQLRRWLYEGAQDIARKTHLLKRTSDIAMTANVYSYTVPNLCLEVEMAYWVPGGADTRIVPMIPRPYGSMDNIRGAYPGQGSSTPQLYTVWGYAPTLAIEVWPPPYANSTLRIYGSYLPVAITYPTGASDLTNLDVPDGYTDVVIDYAEYNALRKDRDPRWQEAKQLYDEKIGVMIETQDYLSAPGEFIYDSPAGPLPSWLTQMN